MITLFSTRKLVSTMMAVLLVCDVAVALAAAATPTPKTESTPKSEKRAVKLDLNTATESELQELSGIGPVYAKKIVAARPYATIQDLTRAGLPPATIAKIKPVVTVKAAAAAPRKHVVKKEPIPATTGEAADRPDTSAKSPTAKRGKAANEAGSATPPRKGMVWVNIDSGIYHKEGSRWYGNTLQGKWMAEADAVKAGYRVSKE